MKSQPLPERIKEIETILSVTPEWLSGCPVEVDTKTAHHYLK